MSWAKVESGAKTVSNIAEYVFLVGVLASVGSIFIDGSPTGAGVSQEDYNNWVDTNIDITSPISTWGPEEYGRIGSYVVVGSLAIALLATIVDAHARVKQGKIQKPRFLGDLD